MYFGNHAAMKRSEEDEDKLPAALNHWICQWSSGGNEAMCCSSKLMTDMPGNKCLNVKNMELRACFYRLKGLGLK